MSFPLDSTASATTLSGSTLTLTLNTHGPNRAILLLIAFQIIAGGPPDHIVTAPSCAGLTFTLVSGDGSAAVSSRFEAWKAFASTQVTGQTVTVTLPATTKCVVLMDAYSGVDPTTQIEAGSVSIRPNHPASTSTYNSQAVTTTSNNAWVISYSFLEGGTPTVGSGYAITGTATNTYATLIGEIPSYATFASGTTVTPTFGNDNNANGGIASFSLRIYNQNTPVFTGSANATFSAVTSTTIPLTCGAGSLVHLFITYSNAGSGAPNASPITTAPACTGLTFTRVDQTNDSASAGILNDLWQAYSSSSQSAQTVTITFPAVGTVNAGGGTAGTSTGALFMLSYTQIDTTTPTEAHAAAGSNFGPLDTSRSAPSVTTSSANATVVSYASVGSSTYTAGPGYTVVVSLNGGASPGWLYAEVAYSPTVTSGTTVTPTWVCNTGNPGAFITASLRSNAASVVVIVRPRVRSWVY